MLECRQREIWWARLPPPAGRRPVLILTRSRAIMHLNNLTIAPLTRTIRGIQSEVFLSPADGVRTECVISCDNIATVPKLFLERRITTISKERMGEVLEAIRFAFDMPPSP